MTRRPKTTARADTLIAYLRVSTEEQANSGLGLEAQRAAITAAAAGQGLEIVEWCIDEGRSAKTLDRPELNRALSAVQSGQAAGLVVSRLDRLSRRLTDLLALVDRAQREGWRLVALDLGVDTATAPGRFVASMLGAVAELERNLVSERTKAALAAKKARGDRLGRPVTLPAETRRLIADLRAEGLTLRAIGAELDRRGVPTARGGAWAPATVAAVLRSVELDVSPYVAT